MQKSTFLEKAIHKIEMYNKNILFLLGSGDAYLYKINTYYTFWIILTHRAAVEGVLVFAPASKSS